jgi:glycosyltransferase involved in cell wall biosynthesis
MRILYVYDKMPGVYQNYLVGLLNHIKTKADISVLTYSANEHGDFSVETYGVRDNLQRAFYKLKMSKDKSRDIKIMKQFDVIHIQHSYLKAKIAPLLYQPDSPRIVVTLRGGDTYLRPWLYDDWKNLYSEYGKAIDAFITMSQHQKSYVQRWGVSGDKIHVIPVSFGMHSDAKPKHPNTGVLKLVSAFRMTWEKNIEGCIRFAKTLKEREIPFSYDIYGDGEDLSQLYYLIDRFNLHGMVHPKGKVDNEELKRQLTQCDFFIQLSISEALGNSVLEAQSLGVPCLVSDSDGLPETVNHGKSGIVSDYANIGFFVDECLELWKDKERYKAFSAEAIQFANENFSLEKETDRLLNLYNALMAMPK